MAFGVFPYWSQFVTGFVGGMGQMLPALSTNCLQQPQTGFDPPHAPSQSLPASTQWALHWAPSLPSLLSTAAHTQRLPWGPFSLPQHLSVQLPLCPRWLKFSSARSNHLFLKSHWLLQDLEYGGQLWFLSKTRETGLTTALDALGQEYFPLMHCEIWKTSSQLKSSILKLYKENKKSKEYLGLFP